VLRPQKHQVRLRSNLLPLLRVKPPEIHPLLLILQIGLLPFISGLLYLAGP
jgi:hypothetical protein